MSNDTTKIWLTALDTDIDSFLARRHSDNQLLYLTNLRKENKYTISVSMKIALTR